MMTPTRIGDGHRNVQDNALGMDWIGRVARNGMAGWRAAWRMAAVVGLTLLASCSDSPEGANLTTWLIVAPSSVLVEPGIAVSAKVSVGRGSGPTSKLLRVSIVPETPGVTLTRTDEPCDLPSGDPILQPSCRTYHLVVSADTITAGTTPV